MTDTNVRSPDAHDEQSSLMTTTDNVRELVELQLERMKYEQTEL